MRTDYLENRPKIKIGWLAKELRDSFSSRDNFSDEDVMNKSLELVYQKPELMYLDDDEKKKIARQIFCSLRCELEILQDLSDDAEISEIMVNGPDHIFYEKHGSINRAPISFDDSEQLQAVIQRLAAKVGREINDLNPIVDARLSDGSRFNAVNKNIAIGGPILTIRKFNQDRLTMDELISNGDISEEAAEFIKAIVKAKYNCFVCGGTSSGKTTFLNILSDYIPRDERIIVIEDSAELQIRNHENLVRMESRQANSQNKGEISIRDLIKASLRMRPDRVIVGEVRGAEVIDMLAAMSTGHDGSLSTGHANSPKGMISRLETMHIASSGFPIAAVKSQIAGAIEIFIHLMRFPGGHRKVVSIAEVDGIDGDEIRLNEIFKYESKNGLVRCGELIHREKLERLQGI